MTDTMNEPCGCTTREGHAEAFVDPVLHIEHGERDELNGDPLPHAVPGTGGWNGFYTASPDAFCLCGHPNYLTCEAWPMGGVPKLEHEPRIRDTELANPRQGAKRPTR